MELVEDVLVNVFEHISQRTGWSGHTLRAVRLTCKRFNRLARPILLRYLELRPSNLNAVLDHLASPSFSWRVRGIRFPDLDRGLDDPNRHAGLGQSVAAEVLRSHPHLEELNFAMFAGTSVDPCLAAALGGTTGSVKRLTISVSEPPPSEFIVDQILASLHPDTRLDVLHLAGSSTRPPIWLVCPIGVHLRSLVVDYPPVVELGPSWRRQLESRRPRVVDLPSLDSAIRRHPLSPGVLADVEALSVPRYSGLSESFDRLGPLPDGSPRSPKLRIITCEASWAHVALRDVVDGNRPNPFFEQVTTLIVVEPPGRRNRIVRLESVAGLPRLNLIIVVGPCIVEVVDPSANVTIQPVDYPCSGDDEFFGRVDLLWLLDTGDVRFLPE